MNATLRQTSSLAVVSLVAGILGWTLLPFLGSVAAVVTAGTWRAARSAARLGAWRRRPGDRQAGAGYLSIAMAVLVVFASSLFFGGLAAFLALPAADALYGLARLLLFTPGCRACARPRAGVAGGRPPLRPGTLVGAAPAAADRPSAFRTWSGWRRAGQERRAHRRIAARWASACRGRHGRPAAGQPEAAHVPPAPARGGDQPARLQQRRRRRAGAQRRAQARQRNGLLGINIGKNKDRPTSPPRRLPALPAQGVPAGRLRHVSISSPNTAGLRELQEERALRRLVSVLREEQEALAGMHGKRVPMWSRSRPTCPRATSMPPAGCSATCRWMA